MFKISRPVLLLLIATVAVAIYLVSSPSSPTTTTVKKPPKPVVSVTSTLYTKEDYNANFPKAVLASRDAFQPLVMRKSGAIAVALAAAGNIPAEFAAGDPNWACTGTTEVDGVQQALLENKSTNDGVFVKQGDHWKSSVVSQVLEDGLVLVGPGGDAKTIHVKQDTATDETDLSGNMPVQPQLSGPIGGGQNPAAQGQVTQVPSLPSPDTSTTTTTDDNNAG